MPTTYLQMPIVGVHTQATVELFANLVTRLLRVPTS